MKSLQEYGVDQKTVKPIKLPLTNTVCQINLRGKLST